ncbi:MAG: MMPL family transporter, partial [Longimicrobiales bacterium]
MSVWTFLRTPNRPQQGREPGPRARAGFHICKPIRRFHKVILLLASLATAVGGYFTSQLGLDTDLRRLIPSSYPSVQAAERVEQELGSVSQLRVALRSQSFDALVRLADVLAVELAQSDYVRSVDYVNDVEFYETNALLFLSEAVLDSLYDAVEDRLDEERRAANPFIVDDLFADPTSPEEDTVDALAVWEEEYEGQLPSRYYLNPDSSVLIMSLNASGSATLGFSQEMVADVRQRIEGADPGQYAPDMEVFYGSSVKNQVDEFEAIEADILGTLGFGLGGVFLILVLIFRGLVTPILISLSMFATLTWTFGIAYLVIGDLNVITGFLFVVLFGMGVDYGIHAMARYRESRQAGEDSDVAIHRMACVTGSANFTASFTTATAFFALMLLDFKGFSELGLITGLGVLFAVLAMAVVLPSLVIVSEDLGLLKVKPVPGKPLHAERRPLPFARQILVGGAAITVVSIALFTQVGFEYDFTNLR